MIKDPDEVDRLNRNEARMGREAARAEDIPRSPELVDDGRKTKDRRGLAAPTQPCRMQPRRKQLHWSVTLRRLLRAESRTQQK